MRKAWWTSVNALSCVAIVLAAAGAPLSQVLVVESSAANTKARARSFRVVLARSFVATHTKAKPSPLAPVSKSTGAPAPVLLKFITDCWDTASTVALDSTPPPALPELTVYPTGAVLAPRSVAPFNYASLSLAPPPARGPPSA